MNNLIAPNSSLIMRRAESTFPLARVTVNPDSIVVEYGRIAWGRFLTVERAEALSFDDNPELTDLYRGGVWDIDMLHALISPAISEDTTEKDNQE